MRFPLAVLAAFLAAPAAAQVPAGPEKVVNTYTSGGQMFPAVAHLPEKPPAWQPLVLAGRWMTDAWGGGLFHAERILPST